MVSSGHDSGPAEPLHRFRDPGIVGGDQNAAYQRSLLDLPVNVLYQWLSIDFY
jgi:hypothetical protein